MVKRSEIVFITLTTVFVVAAMVAIYVWYNGNPFSTTFPRNSIVIFGCSSIDPFSLTVKAGDSINFVNAGGADHNISVFTDSFVVPAGEVREVTANFAAGEAVYGYSCDSLALAGQVQVISGRPAALVAVSFRDSYEAAPADKKSCLEDALGAEFQKAYDDSTYVPRDVYFTLEKMEACLK